MAGTVRDISTRTTNELIVFNTPGSTTIGIKTGKYLISIQILLCCTRSKKS